MAWQVVESELVDDANTGGTLMDGENGWYGMDDLISSGVI